MKKAGTLLGLSALLMAAAAAWQVAACYVANFALQTDMKDLAVQNSARIGLTSFDTEDELRNAVIASGKEHGIPLAPEEVTVRRMLTPRMLDVSLAADYHARVRLLGLSFPLHFTPSSSHRGEIIVK